MNNEKVGRDGCFCPPDMRRLKKPRMLQTRSRLRPDVFFHNPLVSLWVDYRLSTSRAPLNLCGCRLSFACVSLRTSWLCWLLLMLTPMIREWWTWLRVSERRRRWEKRQVKPDFHNKGIKHKVKFHMNKNVKTMIVEFYLSLTSISLSRKKS